MYSFYSQISLCFCFFFPPSEAIGIFSFFVSLTPSFRNCLINHVTLLLSLFFFCIKTASTMPLMAVSCLCCCSLHFSLFFIFYPQSVSVFQKTDVIVDQMIKVGLHHCPLILREAEMAEEGTGNHQIFGLNFFFPQRMAFPSKVFLFSVRSA